MVRRQGPPSWRRAVGCLLGVAVGVISLAAAPIPALAAQLARPFTVDDLLKTEAFGSVSFSPDGSRVVWETRDPYDTADRYDFTYLGAWSTSRLWTASVETSEPASPLLGPEEGRGHVIGAWSPAGRRLLVHRLREADWRSGVMNVQTGAVCWFDVGAEPAVRGQTQLWRGEDQVILIVRADRQTPYDISGLGPGVTATEARWRASRAGGTGVTVWGGGVFAERDGFSAPTQVVSIDVGSGAQTVLAEGRAVDIELSPNHRWLAVVDRGPPYPVRPDQPFRPLEQAEARRLVILDLASGVSWSPCGDCDIAPGLLSWSPSGNELLVWVRDVARGPAAGRLSAFDPSVRSGRDFGLGTLQPDVGASPDTLFQTVRADWLGDRPVLLAHSRPGRRDWYRLTDAGPVKLTGSFQSPPMRLEAIWGDQLLVVADGYAWSIGTTGERHRIGSASEAIRLTSTGHFRSRYNDPPRRSWMIAGGAGGELQTLSLNREATTLASEAEDPPIWTAISRRAAVERRVANGAQALSLHQPGRPSRQLGAINTGLRAVAFAKPEAVRHPLRPELNSWLYRPPFAPTGEPLPLVVVAYPGVTPRPQTDPAELNAMTNIQLIASSGYAVLVPDLPRQSTTDPAAGVVEQLVAALDDVLAQNSDLDSERVGYLGHSFGGYAGLLAASRTDRFSSFVILSAPSDLTSAWGEFAGFGRADRAFGVTSRRNAGWGEEAQGAVGGPPWMMPNAYVSASPIFQAHCIRAPVLLIHGERDFIPVGQAELMFTALWRQNKDVELVTYWGEPHLFTSPGNIRDLQSRISDWFDRTLSPKAMRPSGESDAPNGEPRPRGTPPPECPRLRPAT